MGFDEARADRDSAKFAASHRFCGSTSFLRQHFKRRMLPDCWHVARNPVVTGGLTRAGRTVKAVDSQLIAGLQDFRPCTCLTPGGYRQTKNVENHTSRRWHAMALASCRQTGRRLGCRNRKHVAFRDSLWQTGRHRHQGGHGNRRSGAVPAPRDESRRSALYREGSGDGSTR
jgi:hypothetical protein